MSTTQKTFSVKNGIDVANTIILDSSRNLSNIAAANLASLNILGNLAVTSQTSLNALTTFIFSGDSQKVSLDSSTFRLGSWSVVASGTLYNLVTDTVMWYWIHNCAIDNNGNFLGRDDPGPVVVWVYTENALLKSYFCPADSNGLSGTVPSTWKLTSLTDLNNGIMINGGVQSNSIIVSPLVTPSTPVGTANTLGGTLAAGNYYAKLVALDMSGSATAASLESTVVTTTGSTSSIVFTWTPIDGTLAYQLWVSQTSGTEASYYNISGSGQNSFKLTSLSGIVLSSVAISGTAGQFTCAAQTAINFGQPVTVSGVLTGTGTIVGYVNPTTYIIIGEPTSTTFQLLSQTSGYGQPITTTAGTITGLTFTLNAPISGTISTFNNTGQIVTSGNLVANNIIVTNPIAQFANNGVYVAGVLVANSPNINFVSANTSNLSITGTSNTSPGNVTVTFDTRLPPGAGGGTPGGSNGQIQINNNGAFGGTTNLTFNTAANLTSVDSNVRIANTNQLLFGGSQANSNSNSRFSISYNVTSASLDFTTFGF